jgi:hypothetical protein
MVASVDLRITFSYHTINVSTLVLSHRRLMICIQTKASCNMRGTFLPLEAGPEDPHLETTAQNDEDGMTRVGWGTRVA